MKYLISNPVFLREYEKEMLRDIGYATEYRKGEMILSLKEVPKCLYLVESGWVRIYGPGGLRRAGDIIGLEDLLCCVSISGLAVAIRNTLVISVKKEDFLELLNLNPYFLNRVLGLLDYKNQKKAMGAGQKSARPERQVLLLS